MLKMIKITRKTKTILLIMGILFFPFFISNYLFPYQASEKFCSIVPPSGTIWLCAGSKADALMLSLGYFLVFTFISFLLMLIWTFIKKKPKYIVFVLFSWLFFPFPCKLMLTGILYRLFPYKGMYYIESNYNLLIPALWIMLFSLLWLMPILISFIRYKRRKINKENLQNNIYKWLRWSIWLYIMYTAILLLII